MTKFLDTTTEQIHQNMRGNYRFLHKKLTKIYRDHIKENDKSGFIQTCRNHRLLRLLVQEPVTKWSFNKPRGYSGDAELIDYLYRLKGPDSHDSYLARELYADILDSSVCQSVRWRARHLADRIDALYSKHNRPLNGMSIASGHLRELHYIQHFDQKINRFYAIDQDPMSNEEARLSHPYSQLEIKEESILSIIRKKYVPPHPLDFIYSAGLLDYLNDKLATRLIASAFEFVTHGGVLLVANFAKGIEEQAYMEAFMDWHLIYRDEDQMKQLISDIPEIKIKELRLYRDPERNVVYMEISKY